MYWMSFGVFDEFCGVLDEFCGVLDEFWYI